MDHLIVKTRKWYGRHLLESYSPCLICLCYGKCLPVECPGKIVDGRTQWIYRMINALRERAAGEPATDELDAIKARLKHW